MGDQCIVESPPGELTGTVSQTPTLVSDGFHVFNSEKQKVFQIYGDIGLFERDFLIFTAGDEKQEIGVISKQWAGFWKEVFTNADVFRVTFSKNLDVKLKTVLIGATFLIDYMFYERKN